MLRQKISEGLKVAWKIKKAQQASTLAKVQKNTEYKCDPEVQN